MITENLIDKYLIYLYDDYTLEYGDSLVNLDKSGELTIGQEFADENPKAVIHLEKSMIRNLASTLAEELEIRGYTITDNLSVYLSKEGINEAKRLKAPIISFIKLHWKWFVGTGLAFVTAIVAIIRLINC